MAPPLSEDLLRLAAVLMLVALNGFFVAAEYALVSSSPTRLEAMAERGNRLAALVLRFKRDPNRFISAVQLGVTMMSLALGWLGEETMAHLVERLLAPVPFLSGPGTVVAAHTIAVPVAYILLTSLHIVLGEQVPKLITLQRPEPAALLTVQPLRLWGQLFRPLITVLSWATTGVLRLLGVPSLPRVHAPHSAEELRLLLSQSEALDELEQDIAERAVEFGELAVRQVMVPRTEVVALPAQATLLDLLETSVRTGHHRFPVYRTTPDEIIGIADTRGALEIMVPGGREDSEPLEARLRRIQVAQIMREPLTVPETLSVTRVMAEMRRRRQRAAIVVDEYGGTAGFVTWGDILERVVGEIPQEYGVEAPEIQPLPGGGALVDGRTLIEDVNERFGLHIEAAGYDTIGGFVFSQLGRKPEIGDEVTVDGYRLRVEALDGLRIATVRLEPAETVAPQMARQVSEET
jgi:CBS domain containing-hemolysin-like protein